MVIIFALFLAVFSLTLIFIGGIIYGEGDSQGIAVALFSVILLFLATVFFREEARRIFYKEGQVDALSGSNVQYELKVQPDSSRVWVRKDDN